MPKNGAARMRPASNAMIRAMPRVRWVEEVLVVIYKASILHYVYDNGNCVDNFIWRQSFAGRCCGKF